MRPAGELYLASNEGVRFFGPESFELLKGIEKGGSLAASAKAAHMSYSKAMRLLHEAEAGVGCVLADRVAGGQGGGGSLLTSEAHGLLARYETWARTSDGLSGQAFEACFAGVGEMPRIGCIVMASGKGRRFGSQKLLEPFAGGTVLEHTLRCIPAEWIDAVVVARSREVKSLCESLDVECVVHDGIFQSDTIKRGLDVMDARPACMFLQGDQPLLSQETMQRLVTEACLHPGRITRLSWAGEPASPVIFPACLYRKLRSLRGDKGGSSLLKQYPELRERVHCVEAAHEWEVLDIDTPEDLEELERIAREQGL